MFLYKNRIVITGGTGRFGQELKKTKNKYQLFFPSKSQLNILKKNSIKNYLKQKKPKYLIHLAGLSRPMNLHDKLMEKSISLNIIGTANITQICSSFGIKLIYFSTSYVYPGTKGNYKENDPVLPINSYAWSKLGGESAVQMYKNSLILRASMTEKPFVHKKAFSDFVTNFTFHEELVKNLFRLINKKGIINFEEKFKMFINLQKNIIQILKKYRPKKFLEKGFH